MSTIQSDDGPVADASNWGDARIAERLPGFVPNRIGVILLALTAFGTSMTLLVGVIVVFVLVVGLASVAGGGAVTAQSLGTVVWIAMLAGYLTWIPIVGVVVWFFDIPFPIRVPDGSALFEGGAAWVALTSLAIGGQFALLEYTTTSLGGTTVTEPGLAVVFMAIATLAIGGTIEEFLFRGTIQGILRDEFSAVAAIVGANVLFVPLHVFNSFGQPPIAMVFNLAIVGLLGLVAGVLYERHRNLVVPAVLHGTYNLVVISVGFLL